MKKSRRKKINKKAIPRSCLKIFVILLLIAMNWQGILGVGKTLAYFNDTEGSSENIYSASTLDFSLRSGQTNFIPPAQNMIPGTSTARDIYITKLGDLDFKYKAHSEPVDGFCDLDLYNALQLKVWYNWYDATGTKHMDLKYDGLLQNFDDFNTNPNDPDLRIYNNHPYYPNPFYAENEHWLYFQITLPEDIGDLQNKTCQFKFVFDGWQTDFDSPSIGFSDTEEIFNTIATGDWMPQVTVESPNGGETWYMVPDDCPNIPSCSAWCQAHGMNDKCEYPIEWTAINKIGPDMDLWIDIYYSVDSGNTWMAQIADHTENDGIFWWKIPYDNSYASHHARIKVEAIHKTYPFLTAWDMSDADFCPPMLSLEAILAMQQQQAPQDNTGTPSPSGSDSPTEEVIDSTDSADSDNNSEIITPPQSTSSEEIFEDLPTDSTSSDDEATSTQEQTATSSEILPVGTEDESNSTQGLADIPSPTSTQPTSSESLEIENPPVEQNATATEQSSASGSQQEENNENALTTEDIADESQPPAPENQEENQTEQQETQENNQQDLTEQDLSLPNQDDILLEEESNTASQPEGDTENNTGNAGAENNETENNINENAQ